MAEDDHGWSPGPSQGLALSEAGSAGGFRAEEGQE